MPAFTILVTVVALLVGGRSLYLDALRVGFAVALVMATGRLAARAADDHLTVPGLRYRGLAAGRRPVMPPRPGP